MPDQNRLFLSPPHMSGEERRLVEQVFDSNWIAPIGPMVDRFEAELVMRTGTAHVAALSSGTAALHLALRLAGVGPGDNVWCSTMTFIGGVAPIRYVGAEPIFLDVRQEDYLLDLELLAEELARAEQDGSVPKAVLTTDIYGNVVDQAEMARLRRRFGFIWISDTAEALGSMRGGVHAGDGADFIIHSFNGNKIITTSGGGALASNDEETIDRARFLATQARDQAPHYEHSTYGYNYRLSNVCAAIGVGQIAVLDERVAARRRIFDAYRDRLGGLAGFEFDQAEKSSRPNRWLTTVTIGPRARCTREQVRLGLAASDIEARPMWKPMHLQPVFAGTGCVGGGGNSEEIFANGLCLPSGSAMDEGAIDRVCKAIEALAK